MNSTIFEPVTNLSFTHKLLISFVLGSFSFLGLIFYFTIWLVIIRNYNEFKTPFYLYMISAGIPDMAFSIITIFYCIPCTVLSKDVYSNLGSTVIGYLNTFIYGTQSAHIFYVALNRWSYVTSKSCPFCSISASCNISQRIVFTIIFLWISSLALLCLDIVTGFYWRYSYTTFVWEPVKLTQSNMEKLNVGIFTMYTILSTILYGATWTIIVIKRKNTVGDQSMVEQTSKREFRLLLQFSIISGIVIIYLLGARLATAVTEQTKFKIIGDTLVNILGTVNASTNPFVYLIFDQKIKTAVRKDFKSVVTSITNGCSRNTPISSTTTIPQSTSAKLILNRRQHPNARDTRF